MTENMIGEAAGEVWRYLERNGGRAELNAVRTHVRTKEGVSPDLATGWLAREGKIHFSSEHGNIQVGIRRDR